jgi:predicted outer membrane protein
MALRRSDDERIRRFAAALEADLPAAKIAMMQLGPRSSDVDQQLTRATDAALRDLELRRGGDFDRAFILSEQTSLATALRVLDETLIPRAVSTELGRRLSAMRAVLAEELSKANALVSPP